MTFRTSTFLVASALAVAFSLPVQAQTFNFRWDGEADPDTKYENPVNWFNETDGTNFNNFIPVNDGVAGLNFNVAARNGGTIDFDDDSSLTLAGAADAQVQVNRIFLGSPGSGSNSGTLNVSGGSLNAVQSGAGINSTVGRAQDGTLNISGGSLQYGQKLFVGSGVSGHGEVNVSGGELILYRGGNSAIMTGDTAAGDIADYGRPSADLGDDDGDGAVDGEGMPIENTTTGVLNISGGAFSTRAGIAIGKYGTVDVQGSGASQIGIGSNQSLDGFWLQYAGGTLRAGVDAGGITPILIDDVDDDGQGDVKFYDGTFLDPYDLGGAIENIWHTVMQWDGTLLENGLALTADATSAGWEMQILGNLLQVKLPGAGGGLAGDYNADGLVNAVDYTVWRDNLGLSDAALNGNGTGDVSGTVVAADYDAWNSNYGASAFSAVSIPEPGALLLVLAGIVGSCCRTRRV